MGWEEDNGTVEKDGGILMSVVAALLGKVPGGWEWIVGIVNGEGLGIFGSSREEIELLDRLKRLELYGSEELPIVRGE